jgi:hypothetical protein
LELRFVAVVIGTGGEMGEGTLEAAVVGTVLGGETEMPLSGEESEVAGVFEEFGEGYDAFVEVALVAVGVD